eukprot:CAMPEP_0175777668 /NCGR_PEP_ID=MMETSP0097-20121207/75279_1 /TAXON_ID=311494 /ORGANISM="Alexandrium monilatum, Strain CCMP3105" /LENGTH=55 /DNA_ID=CAMNT_0017088251 /DNA_START=40 /DNA_END=207 /DNA_ORIENTATION=-
MDASVALEVVERGQRALDGLPEEAHEASPESAPHGGRDLLVVAPIPVLQPNVPTP